MIIGVIGFILKWFNYSWKKIALASGVVGIIFGIVGMFMSIPAIITMNLTLPGSGIIMFPLVILVSAITGIISGIVGGLVACVVKKIIGRK
jgi:uncharacterized membrane protein